MGIMDSFNRVKYTVLSKVGNPYQKSDAIQKLDELDALDGVSDKQERREILRNKNEERKETQKNDYKEYKKIIEESEEKKNYVSKQDLDNMKPDQYLRYVNTLKKGDVSFYMGNVINDVMEDRYNLKVMLWDDSMQVYKVSIGENENGNYPKTYAFGDLTILDELGEKYFDARDKEYNSIDKAMTKLLSINGIYDGVVLSGIMKEMLKQRKNEELDKAYDEGRVDKDGNIIKMDRSNKGNRNEGKQNR